MSRTSGRDGIELGLLASYAAAGSRNGTISFAHAESIDEGTDTKPSSSARRVDPGTVKKTTRHDDMSIGGFAHFSAG